MRPGGGFPARIFADTLLSIFLFLSENISKTGQEKMDLGFFFPFRLQASGKKRDFLVVKTGFVSFPKWAHLFAKIDSYYLQKNPD